MRRRGGWTGRVVGVAAGVTGLMLSAVGVLPAAADEAGLEPISVAGTAVSLAQSGELVTWGEDETGPITVPAQYAGVAFSQVVMPSDAVLALTASGQVVGWGTNEFRLQQVPAAVAAEKVVQIAATNFGYVGAVTADGRVLVWGVRRARPTPLDIPAGLSDVKQLALFQEAAVALKHDGTVVAWGDPTNGVTNVPAGLRATQVNLVMSTATALTTEGAVVQWGGNSAQIGRPAAVEQPGNVKAIAAGGQGVLAWLADDSLVAWPSEGQPVPPSVAAAQPLLLGESFDRGYIMVDQDRIIRPWLTGNGGPSAPDYDDAAQIPADIHGRAITQAVLAYGYVSVASPVSPASVPGAVIVTKMLRAALPRVAGTARVGSVLTGMPGTFSAVPDSVSSQWLIDGAPVAGNAPQLSVTAAMAGKTIAYRSTATKTGETTQTSTSAGVKVATPPPSKVASKTRVVKVKVAKKAVKVTVTGKVTATKPATGKAKVTIKKGKKIIVTKNVNVTAKGAVKLNVKKFSKLVIKKTKAKGKKAKTAHRGTYTITVAYGGNAQVKPSNTTKKFKIKK